MTDTGVELLAEAIIARACDDYRKTLRKLKKNNKYLIAIKDKVELEAFFKSQWFVHLTTIDGLMVMEKIKEEVGYDD